MDDNTQNNNGNQPPTHEDVPKPIFETFPVETTPSSEENVNLQPEELAPDISAPEEVSKGGLSPEVAPTDQPLVYEESKSKYVVIGLGVVFFLFVVGIIFWVLSGITRGGGGGMVKKTSDYNLLGALGG